MSRLSKEAEQKISRALDKVADFVDAGEHPTDAVVKAAQECRLEPGHGRLLGTAYNTGRAAVQRESSTDTFDKAAEFELADPDLVVQQLTAGMPKQASTDEVSAEYSQPPTALREHYRLQKMAEVSLPALPIKHGPLPIDNDGEFSRARGRAKVAQDKYADCHMVVSKMCDELEASLAQAADMLTTIGAPAVATLQKVAELRGDAGVTAILSEYCRRHPLLTKRAASLSPVLTAAEQAAYSKAQKLVSDVADVGQAHRMLEHAKQAAVAVVTQELRPHVPERAVGNDPWADLNGPLEMDKEAVMSSPLTAMFGAAMGSRAGGPQNNNDQVEAHMAALDDPQQAQRLNGIRARSTVEGLMASDPVLKGYHPDDVIDAYNSIVQAAPRVANQQLFLQGALRRYLAQGGAFDPDDVTGNVYKADESVQKQQQLPQGQVELTKTQPSINNRNRMDPLNRIWGGAGQAMATGKADWLRQDLEGAQQAAP